MNIKTWISENKTAAILGVCFLGGFAALGWLAWSAWGEFDATKAEYDGKLAQFAKFAAQKPFPNAANLKKTGDALNQSRSDLDSLQKQLEQCRIPPFGDLEKTKPQEQPQSFQDALRKEVTRIKGLATSAGSTLPPSFYLGMEEYENKLPQPEEAIPLARQLTVLNRLATTLVSQKGIIVSEFSRFRPDSGVKKDPATLKKPGAPPVAGKKSDSDEPYETIGITRMTFRCSQTSLREIVNALSSGPYFQVIDSIQIQNSSTEPPRREAPAQTSAQPSTQSTETSATNEPVIQRLPIVVGRETLTVTIKVRALDFPKQNSPAGASK